MSENVCANDDPQRPLPSGARARIFASSADEEICITGMSGQFPASRNVAEFEENLYSKVDMINDHCARWPHFHTEIPRRSGNISDVDRFDAQFFGVNRKQAEIMDPQGRLLLERAYEAITDAGVNPKSLRGSRTGVYIGACFAESEKTWFYDRLSERGFGITGCSRAMLANRISYSLGLEGPSFLLDTACSSSMYALDAAFSAMRSGQCDAAIVGGTNLLLNPNTTVQFARLGVLAADGYCRPFDRAASGYVRAEAVCTVFLQRRGAARRCYATVVYSKTNCDGFKVQGITYPSGRVQEKLLTEFYADAGVNPTSVEYVEAHSTGTVAGDPEECVALDRVFCQNNRPAPLLVGSVKSNIGHSESTSGACSIAKVVLAFERGAVAPNINYAVQRPEIDGLTAGRMRVCTEATPLQMGANTLVGINSFGFGGANAHALLRANGREKQSIEEHPADDLPRLIHWAGRTEESIDVMMVYLRSHPLDAEFVALLHSIQAVEEPGFLHRSYGLFSRAEDPKLPAICQATDVRRFDGQRRPMVWMFSGMGSQWPQMGSALMRLPAFRESVERSAKLVRPLGIDLLDILTNADRADLFDDIVNSFVGIAAVQIGLVDVLHLLDLQPDFLIGHSVGELGCGYADGALSAEQMLVAAYWRGQASKEAGLPEGMMAAIGMGYKDIMKEEQQLPADIDVACHNSAESCTISGPSASVRAFVERLRERGIFARMVNSSNIAYHSRYVGGIADRLLERTRDLLGEPKRRSDRWLSTSAPRERWSEPEVANSCSQYYVNNLLNSVLFEEAAAALPKNAIVVEIAPHGLLQAIVKRSMPEAVHVPLTRRASTDGVAFLLEALGQLYVSGCTMPLERLYPIVEFPVSRGTAKIASLMRWDHGEQYFVTRFEVGKAPESGEMRVRVNLGDSEYAYVAGHQIDGRCLFPATGYLELVWHTFARMRGSVHHLLNVEFEDVQFLRATALHSGAPDCELTVMVHYGNGTFEVSEGAASICTGIVRAIAPAELPIDLPPVECAAFPDLGRAEFYKELRLRGYQYRDAFRAVERARSDGLAGRIRWDMNWVAFMDCMLQCSILARDTRSLMLPTRIQRVRIFPAEHTRRVPEGQAKRSNMTANPADEELLCDVLVNRELNVVQAGGVEIFGLVTNVVARRKTAGDLVLEAYKFVPYEGAASMGMDEAVRVMVQLVLENLPHVTVLKAVEIVLQQQSEPGELIAPLLCLVDKALGQLPTITGNLRLLSDMDAAHFDMRHGQEIEIGQGKIAEQSNVHLIVGSDAEVDDPNFWTAAEQSGAFVLIQVSSADFVILEGFNVCSRIATDIGRSLILLRKEETNSVDLEYSVVDVSAAGSGSFEWLDELKMATAQPNSRIVLLAQQDPQSGILGLVNCVRRELFEAKSVTCVFVDDARVEAFDVRTAFYSDQLRLDLAVNVYKDGAWGSYRHLALVDTNDTEEPTPATAKSSTTTPTLSHFYANVLRTGDLSSFAWLQGPLNRQPLANLIADDLISVHYASINFRDVMLATGRLPAELFDTKRRIDRLDCVLGLEYAGLSLADGRRTMGMVTAGAMATVLRPFRPLTWTVPERWSLREAATVPVVYVTVYLAFFVGRVIAAGKSILIHAGSGGVGLAAIRVALAYGLEVYTTVSSAQKKRYIMQMFGQLKESNIGCSRDCSFERLIKLRTRGRGVDFVLNSLSDDKLLASVRCLGRGGTFLEIGKFDMANDAKIGLGVFLKEMSFRSVLADNLFEHPDGDEQTRYIHALIDRDLRSGVIQPLDSTVFQVTELEKAYRYLSTGQHVGKVLVHVQRLMAGEAADGHDLDEAVAEEQTEVESLERATILRRVYFDAERVYVIAGGLGGFGLELADWLVLRGARRILLSSRHGISSKYQVYRMRMWQTYGCNVHISTADIRTLAGCRELLTQAGHLGTIDGLFNLAVFLNDAALPNQTAATFRDSFAPKAVATEHLDLLTREICPQLRHFVCFSSVSCGRGNAGQTNYGMANAVMERIVERRRKDGLAGLAIQWGAVGDVGLVADKVWAEATADAAVAADARSKVDEVIVGGTLQQPMASCLAVLDRLLCSNESCVSSMVVAHKSRISGGQQKRAAAATTLLESVLNIMCIRNANTIAMGTRLSELGMDSLMTIEIKQALEREYEVCLSAHDLRAMTFGRLHELSEGGKVAELVQIQKGVSDEPTGITTMFDMAGILLEPSQRIAETSIYQLSDGVNGGGGDGEEEVRTWIVMPGAEGDNRPVWKTIADRLDGATYIVRYDDAKGGQGVPELAHSYAQEILDKFPPSATFNLIGYSFGTMVAIEVARHLEQSGRTGRLVCIDGAPAFLRRLIYDFCRCSAAEFSVPLLETRIAASIAQTYVPDADVAELRQQLDRLTGWPAKLNAIADFARQRRGGDRFNDGFMRTFADGLYQRALSTIRYACAEPPAAPIAADVMLVRAADGGQMADIEADYGLASCTRGRVEVRMLAGNHQTLLQSVGLAAIVNGADG